MGKGGAGKTRGVIPTYIAYKARYTPTDKMRILKRCKDSLAYASDPEKVEHAQLLVLLTEASALPEGVSKLDEIWDLPAMPDYLLGELECFERSDNYTRLGARSHKSLYVKVRELASAANIEMPQLYTYSGPKHAMVITDFNDNFDGHIIAISKKALGVLTEDELCGVLAHEIGHIANQDAWRWLYRHVSLWWLRENTGSHLATSPEVEQIRLRIKLITEDQADRFAAKIGYGEKLIRCLATADLHVRNNSLQWADKETQQTHPLINHRIESLSEQLKRTADD